nr:hypothetical protein [Acidobacteriota bacterium]
LHAPDDGACSDGLFCTGIETCDPVEDCQAGTPPVVDDGVACTVDSCDEANDLVLHAPDNGACSDGLFCDGTETCDPVEDCQAGTPPVVDDGVGCTVDTCDEANDLVLHTPDNGACSDGLFCTGTETCDPVEDCQAGTPPVVDDGVGCTVDTCDEANDLVLHAPDDGACSDGLFCTGIETCDPVEDCQAGTPPNCDDSVACTTDSCNETTDSCDHALNDAACDNGQLCDGTETCTPTGCEPGTPVDCSALNDQCNVGACDPATGGCFADPLANGTECDDSNPTTVGDTCQDGICQGVPLSPPPEVDNLMLTGDAQTALTWDGQGESTWYDVTTGYLSELHFDEGVIGAMCLADDQAAPTYTDNRPRPPRGDGYYYLIRAENPVGKGSYGYATTGEERLPFLDCP